MRRVGTLAEEYRKIRRENARRPAKARHALQWARDRVAAYSLYSRADDIKPRRETSFCNESGADVFTFASRNDAIRVELAFIPDDHGPEEDDWGSDDYASFRRYFRNDEKLGRHDAHLAAVRALKARDEAKEDNRDRYAYGISVRIFYGDDENPIGEADCWGFTDDYSAESEAYRWQSALDQYREAAHGLCGKIRNARREAFRAVMAEAFAANFAI